MAYWSPENATNAFINTLKMERKENEPNSTEFISALAAGNNAQIMVAACTDKMVVTNLLALVAAAHQSGGQVICIVPGNEILHSTKQALKSDAKFVHFIVGNASQILLKEYKDADFLLIDCNLEDYENIVKRIDRYRGEEEKVSMVVGYNALCKGSSWQWSGLRTQLLPIGDGLLVTRIGGKKSSRSFKVDKKLNKSNWVVKVDKCTGEEHVFRVRSSQRKLGVTI